MLRQFFLSALLITCAQAATFIWDAPTSVSSGQGHIVGVTCYPTYSQDAGLGAILYKNGSFFAEDYSAGGPSVHVQGYSVDTGTQTITYSVELTIYDGLYWDASDSRDVSIVGSNLPPVATISIDGYANGATVTRPAGGSVNVTVRFGATDADGNLTGIRPHVYASGIVSYFYGNDHNVFFTPQSGGSGELVETWSLNGNGDWLFWTDAKDSVTSPGIDVSDTFVLHVTQAANLPPHLEFDAVSYTGGVLTGSGWAADPELGAPVVEVELTVDGVYRGEAILGDSRPDVVAAYGGRADFLGSGYHFNVNIAGGLTPGTHTASVRAYDIAGGQTNRSLSFTVSNEPPPLKPITVTARSSSKAYDGNGAVVGYPTITSGTLRNGDRMIISGHTASIPAAPGTTTTEVGSVTIRDLSYNDVTALYNVTKVTGNYTITQWTPPGSYLVGTPSVQTSVDNKGAANISIPLVVPPGRAGLQPKLSLNYNSNAGNGPLGTGWSVSTGYPEGISRGRTILARDGWVHGPTHNTDDKLYLDGKRLILVQPAGGNYWAVGNEYRTEVDSFVKVTALGANGAITGSAIEAFKAEAKDGTVFYFGKIDSNSADAVRQFYGLSYHTWALKRVVDPAGNSLEFTYNVYQNTLYNYITQSTGRKSGEHLLAGIDYTANASAGVAAAFGVRFVYTPGSPLPNQGELLRPDVSSGFVAGGENATLRRLVKIEAGPLASNSVSATMRYDFDYAVSPGSGLSRLNLVLQSTRKDLASAFEAVPPVVFTYNNDGADAALEVPHTTSTSTTTVIALTREENRLSVITGDFNGDGRTDKYLDGKVYLGNGTGFDDGVAWLPASLYLGAVVRSGDVDGDGRSDVIWVTHDKIYVARANAEGNGFVNGGAYEACALGAAVTFDGDAFYGYPSAAASRVSIGDFNGDGLTDVLLHFSYRASATQAGLYVCLSNGTTFAAPDRWGGLTNDSFNMSWQGPAWQWQRVPTITYIEPTVADLNNDGVDDYLYIQRDVDPHTNASVTYTTALKVALTKPTFPGLSRIETSDLQWQDKTVGNADMQIGDAPLLKLLIGDCNGDGYRDVLALCERAVAPYVRAPKWCLWANRGWGFADPIEDYMPMEDPNSGAPNHNLDLLYGSEYGIYFWAGNQVQVGGMFLQDINRDGLADFVYGRGGADGWLVKYGEHGGFSATQTLWAYDAGGFGTAWGGYTPYFDGTGRGGVSLEPIELDGDGASDWLLLDTGPAAGSFPLVAKGRNAKLDRLVAVTDGLGATMQIAYKSTTDGTIYTPGVGVSYPIREVRNPQLVVSDLWKDSGVDGASAQFSYQYSGNRTDLSGRGPLGFHSFVTLDRQTNLFKYQFLAQSFPMTGLAQREETYRWMGGTTFQSISSHDNTVVFDKVTDGSGGVFGTLWPFISKAIEYRWEKGADEFSVTNPGIDSAPEKLFAGGRDLAKAHIAIIAQSRFDYGALQTGLSSTGYHASDTNSSGANEVKGTLKADPKAVDGTFVSLPGAIRYGNLTELTTSYERSGQTTTHGETVTTTYYTPAETGGPSGLVKSVATSVVNPDYTNADEANASTKWYTYWSKGGIMTPLVASETIDANRNGGTTLNHALDLKTSYERHATLGYVTETTIASGDPAIGTYSASLAEDFDPTFELPKLTKNAVGYRHRTELAYHPIFGLPTQVKDLENSLVISGATYDALGRVVVSVDAFGIVTSQGFSWAASDPDRTVTPPDPVTQLTLTAKYKVTQTTPGRPDVTTFYDRLGRVIRVRKEGFGGQQVLTDTVYNTLGQVVAVSVPYVDGSSAAPKLWTTTTYDELGRVSTVTAPNNTVTTTDYHGRATQVRVNAVAQGATQVDPGEQVNTTQVDAKGRTIKVWNANNVPSLSGNLGSTATPSVEYRLDGFGRMRETRLEGGGTGKVIFAEYDLLGRQNLLLDPDKGKWTYTNNALGQLVSQTDGIGNVTTSTFDRLGRPLTRITAEAGSGPVETASWYYFDQATNNTLQTVAVGSIDPQHRGWIGSLQRDQTETTGAPGYAQNHSVSSTAFYYDDRGRTRLKLASIDEKWFYTYTTFDSLNRPSVVRHYWKTAGDGSAGVQPYVWQDFGYTYQYNAKGYLMTVTDSTASNRVWWQANAAGGYDHLDRPVLVQKGSGHWTRRDYRATDGAITAITTGSLSGTVVSPVIQNLTFQFDGLGNLTKRTDGALAEDFGYDIVNRLETRGGASTATYTPNGNITWKQAVGGAVTINSYNPTVVGRDNVSRDLPHAVKEYTSGSATYTLAYDGNGNAIGRIGNGESWKLKYTGFDKPRWMTKTVGGTSVGSEFVYNASRSRVMQLEYNGADAGTGQPTTYVRKRVYGVGPALELNYDYVGGATPWSLKKVRIYVAGPEGTIGAREFDLSGSLPGVEKPLVYHHDHLGSVHAITPFGSTAAAFAKDGATKDARYSENAWGQRRNPSNWTTSEADLSTADNGGADSVTPRGFTGHEMLDDLGLVHMNGRIYDPSLGRMLSADILVQNPISLQHYNRYSYVQNNPLTLVDPTGWYSVFGLEFTDGGGITGFVKDLGGYTVDATTGAGSGLYNATIGGAISAGNEAGQMYIDSSESGSGGLASFGYATSMGLGRMSGGMGLVEFYSGERIETSSDGSLKQGEFGSVTEWAVHGAASYAQAGTTAVGIKTLATRVGQAAPKTGAAPEVAPEPATVGPCFAAGTLVLTPDGLVPIEKLNVGDTVVAYDFETGKLAERSVLQAVANRTEYWVFVRVGEEEIQATRTHPFWVESEGAWLHAVDLQPGMVVRLADGRLAPIASTRIVHVESDESTFNLCVQKDHNYFVGAAGVLVHNGTPDEEFKIGRHTLGRYGDVGGHHPHQQAARSNNPAYKPDDALAVKPGTYDHAAITREQAKLNAEAAKSGVKYDLKAEEAIQQKAMEKGGFTSEESKTILEKSRDSLPDNAREPTRIPGTPKKC